MRPYVMEKFPVMSLRAERGESLAAGDLIGVDKVEY